MTARSKLNSDYLLNLFREMAMQQAIDLIEKAHMSPGQVAELYMGTAIEIALAQCLDAEVVRLLRQLADEIESGRDLN